MHTSPAHFQIGIQKVLEKKKGKGSVVESHIYTSHPIEDLQGRWSNFMLQTISPEAAATSGSQDFLRPSRSDQQRTMLRLQHGLLCHGT